MRYRFGDFLLDLSRYQILRDGVPVEISPKGLDLLTYLIQHRDRPVSNAEIAHAVWGVRALSRSSIPTCIAAIRRTLSDCAAAPSYIMTVTRRGYRFIGDVHVEQETGLASRRVAASVGGFAPSFVGRDHEMAVLDTALNESLLGKFRLLLFSGEAGIGKTRLLDEFSTRANSAAEVLVGRCSEDEGAPWFWPWTQVLRELVRRRGHSIRIAGSHTEVWNLADAADLSGDHLKEDSTVTRFRLFREVAAVFRMCSDQAPVIVLLDDLHRADMASIRLLQFIAQELHDVRVMVVGTHREVSRDLDVERSDAIGALARLEPARLVPVGPLSPSEIAQCLMQGGVSRPDLPEIVHAIHAKTAGNPFLIRQLVEILLQDSSRPGDVDRIVLPGSVREAVRHQMADVSESTRRALEFASVMGREFTVAPLARSMKATEKQSLKLLHSAIHAGLLAACDGGQWDYRFTHILVRDAIYDDLPTHERRSAHEAIGRALEDLFGDDLNSHAAEIAHHYFECGSGQVAERAIRFSEMAADWATQQLAFEDPPKLIRRAISLLDSIPGGGELVRGRLLLKLGEAELRSGRRDPARAALREAASVARSRGDGVLLARVALCLAPGLFAIEVGIWDSELVAVLEEALALLPNEDRTASFRARLLARLAIALTWSDQQERREQVAGHAMELSAECDDPIAQAQALSARHGVAWTADRFPERLSVLVQLRKVAESLSDPSTQLMRRLLEMTAALEVGELGRAREYGSLFCELAEHTRQSQFLWYVNLFRAMWAAKNGDFAAAERHAQAFLSSGQEVGDTNAVHSFGIHLAIRRWEENRTKELEDLLKGFVERFPVVTGWQSTLAFFFAELGDRSSAEREYCQLIENSHEFPPSESWLISVALLAEVCAYLNDREHAGRLYHLLEPARRRFCVIGYSVAFWGAVAHPLGLLARTDGNMRLARLHLEEAVELNESVGAVPRAAQSRFDLACVLAGCGDEARALREAERALRRTRGLGMVRLSRKLEALIADLA